jgi:hypothetical protein
MDSWLAGKDKPAKTKLEQYEMPKGSSTRIFVLLASSAPIGVILRRGPSKHVLVLKWHLETDALEQGQWFHGRIYERRCDLSPSGELLLYFAASYKEPPRSWTAISKPPYLTALALWPKGDGWGGGGLFDSELSIQLNHRPGEDVLADGFRLKKNMRVRLFGDRPGWGEDFPIYHSSLLRNGWNVVAQGDDAKPDWNAQVVWRFKEPIVYEKTANGSQRLQMLIKGVNQKNDAWYWLDYNVLDEHGAVLFSLPRADWADWDGSGDLLFAKDGKLFRLKKDSLTLQSAVTGASKQIADLNALKFKAKSAPAEAIKW